MDGIISEFRQWIYIAYHIIHLPCQPIGHHDNFSSEGSELWLLKQSSSLWGSSHLTANEWTNPLFRDHETGKAIQFSFNLVEIPSEE